MFKTHHRNMSTYSGIFKDILWILIIGELFDGLLLGLLQIEIFLDLKIFSDIKLLGDECGDIDIPDACI